MNLKINKRSTQIAQIRRHLAKEDGIKVTQQAISNFWRRYMKTGMLTDEYQGGKQPILSIVHFHFIDVKMEANYELSTQDLIKELRDLIKEQFGLDRVATSQTI